MKPNTAIGFTGGGSRAYIASMGILAALTQLDLMKNVRYIGGISGGSYATLVYSYVQHKDIDDSIFLGDITKNPSEITRAGLQVMDPHCSRSYAASNLTVLTLSTWTNKIMPTIGDAWVYAVSKCYLEPAGILPNQRFSWDSHTVADIISRNPQFQAEDFTIITAKNRPFPIVCTALLGPIEGAPYTASRQNFTLLEVTPLYTGQLGHTEEVRYTYRSGITHTMTVGGAIETYAFPITLNDAAQPKKGLAKGETTAVLTVPEPSTILDIAHAAAASSYAPGSFVEAIHLQELDDALGLHIDYYSPSDPRPQRVDSVLADGGSYENIPLISYLQRRVEKIALFFVSSQPLFPASKYHPSQDVYTGQEITDSLTCFFGVLPQPESTFENRSFEYERDQVYSKDDYIRVVTALQAAQAQGKGIIATVNLTTIENTWWGIPAGITSEITFFYLGRLSAWEAQLSSEMHSLLVPSEQSEDLSYTIQQGDFKHFPNYATTGGEMNAERANVLADLTGWSIFQYADTFRRVFS